jgi:hypothetical protein
MSAPSRSAAALLDDVRSDTYVNVFRCGPCSCVILLSLSCPEVVCGKGTRSTHGSLAMDCEVGVFDYGVNGCRSARLAQSTRLPLESVRSLGVNDASDGIESRLMNVLPPQAGASAEPSHQIKQEGLERRGGSNFPYPIIRVGQLDDH